MWSITARKANLDQREVPFVFNSRQCIHAKNIAVHSNIDGGVKKRGVSFIGQEEITERAILKSWDVFP